MQSRPPVSLTSLVGRERELEDLGARLAAQRLVTLTGVGGSGKTRLAAELALRLDWQRADSVRWVELGTCTDPVLVAQHAAAALSLRAPQCTAADALAEALREGELLLVLDNCEHVVAAAAALARMLLQRCPKLRILATSREPLGVPGEHVWPVPPIAPDDAVRLFADRAAAVDRGFALSAETTPVVREICRRLDSIPLAIELAAARIRVLTPEQIAARLEDRFAILTGGARTADPRHRTLRAAIDWSFNLLSEREQTLMGRLSVFPGTFTLDAAESVCGADLDLMTGLVDKSLVTIRSRRTAVRYELLDTIRKYATERLDASGEGCEMRRRHAAAYLALVRQAVVDPMGDVTAQLELLDGEHDDVRAVLAWSLENEPDAIALPLAAVFRWYWYYRILWSEGLRWLTRTLERSSPAVSHDRAGVLAGAGVMAGYTGDLATGQRWLEEAEAMWRTLGDERELALTLSALAQQLANAGEIGSATGRASESVSLARKAGTPYDIAYCLTNAAAFVAHRRGDLDEADRALEEAESIWAPMRHPLGYPFVLSTRALLAYRRGDRAAAVRFARTTLAESRNYHWHSARAMRVLAYTCEDLPRAARLLGASESLMRAIGARILVSESGEHQAFLSTLRQSMSAEELEAALEAGRSLGVDEAYDLGLEGGEAAAGRGETLHLADLGPLQITHGGQPLANDRASNRARELLAFLLAHPPGPTKEEVGVAFWPDATSEQVKNAFHVTLHRLRKLLGGSETVIVDGARYSVAMPHVVDSRRFETEVTAALRSGDCSRLEAAAALYTGDFLQGEDVGEWCLPIRSRLRQLHLRGLFALGQAYETRGRYTDAAEAYQRVLARDPFHEPSARQLMTCQARLGKRSESLSIYRQLEQRLRDDLQTEPEPETSALYRELRYKTDNASA